MSRFEECINKTSSEIEFKKKNTLQIINQTLSFQLWKLEWADFREAWLFCIQNFHPCVKLQLV